MLGGLAVISHGHARPTYDADIWLDPDLLPTNGRRRLGVQPIFTPLFAL
jgi:hypothetical protein